jgi:DNA-binding MarR family transcriptional regulator
MNPAPRTPPADTRPGGFEDEFPGGSRSANACVRALVRTNDAVMASFHAGLRQHSLSASARQALAALERVGRPMTPTEISARLMVTTASITSLIDTLERRGLVARSADADDRRRQFVQLTDAGKETVDEFLPKIVALQTAMTAKLTEADREQLERLLDIVADTITELDAVAVAAEAPARVPPPPNRAPKPDAETV